jgi:hypothetical protein
MTRVHKDLASIQEGITVQLGQVEQLQRTAGQRVLKMQAEAAPPKPVVTQVIEVGTDALVKLGSKFLEIQALKHARALPAAVEAAKQLAAESQIVVISEDSKETRERDSVDREFLRERLSHVSRFTGPCRPDGHSACLTHGGRLIAADGKCTEGR